MKYDRGREEIRRTVSLAPLRVRCRIRCWHCREFYELGATLVARDFETMEAVPDAPGWICPKCSCGGTMDLVEVFGENEERKE